ncbi:GMC family oxidoreductase [Ramlibacter humi]|uniref:FAD-binding protein n=1 Tax=Ramlibacter humi TaxID=2530451 RepID=A0A4Z0BG11_9BURK|nr:GMC family oxidoreductase [Ramlibacter humi]TFY98266.1 FAD-binding protein [Ramlibacter humi]
MSKLPDPVKEGLARGWQVKGGPHGAAPERVDCDVAIVGTGAGAGITAEILAKAGLKVVLVEEGPLRTSTDFRQRESDAYPSLYQESAARKTRDKAINILQGRCVGGSTTVNWTSSFRTPSPTLAFWRDHFELADFHDDDLAPFFLQAERRLSIGPWLAAPNENNDLLRRGAAKLGIPAAAILRNVKGCWNLGSCGMGCPTNAKQSMLVTTIPWALDHGAQLLVETRAQRFELANGEVKSLLCEPASGAGPGTRITAKHYVLAGGAINSPAVLLRSQAPDPHGRLGARTFLHPTLLSAAHMPGKVEGWQGAPQTIYTDHFLGTQPIDGPIGYKLEAPPIHPVIFASTLTGIGQEQAQMLSRFAFTHVLIALLRDGFHPESPGGTVRLRGDGSAELDYALDAYTLEGARRAMLSMAEIQFAAGAEQVAPVHELAKPYRSWVEAREAINALPMVPRLTKVASAHVMGGCAFAGRADLGVTRPDGVHWQLRNLSIHDGSIFPTSIGANPQLSIYGIVNRLAQGLAHRMTGRDVILA